MVITSNANWSNEPFTLDKMLEAVAKMPPRMDGFFGPALLRSLPRETAPEINPFLGRSTSLYGIPIQESAAFPLQTKCAACDGTGEGTESTFCRKCSGAGENRYEGMVRNGDQTIVLTSPLPKKFAPYFPRGAVALPPISRGLP